MIISYTSSATNGAFSPDLSLTWLYMSLILKQQSRKSTYKSKNPNKTVRQSLKTQLDKTNQGLTSQRKISLYSYAN